METYLAIVNQAILNKSLEFGTWKFAEGSSLSQGTHLLLKGDHIVCALSAEKLKIFVRTPNNNLMSKCIETPISLLGMSSEQKIAKIADLLLLHVGSKASVSPIETKTPADSIAM